VRSPTRKSHCILLTTFTNDGRPKPTSMRTRPQEQIRVFHVAHASDSWQSASLVSIAESCKLGWVRR
jgi:hypothetical protein